MSEPNAVVVPRENVNDESATLVAWVAADGARVEAGQAVAQVETSKAVVDLSAGRAGVLRHKARVGEDVPIGGVVGWVVEEGAVPPVEAAPAAGPSAPTPAPLNGKNHGIGAAPPSPPLSPSVRRIVAEEKVDAGQVRGTGRGGRITKADVLAHLLESRDAEPPPPPPPAGTRISRKAAEVIRELGLDEAAFRGRGLVRAEDVLAATRPAAEAPSSPAPAASPSKLVAASGVPTRAEPLSRAKRTEAKYLRSGAEATLASVVTVGCPTRGFRRLAGDLAAAVVVAEAARLLRKYPAFNAFHDDGSAHCYDEVNVGFAVDAGRGLKVPVVRGADRKTIAAIADEMRELVVAYLDDALHPSALAGGTFTITDLSGEGVTAFHPLINRGQSAILGLGAETPAGPDGAAIFNLILAFDHQLSEGRAAARFLGELRDRLAAYEAALSPGGRGEGAAEPCCSRCGAGYRELAANGHALVQSVRADGSVRLICKLCFEGWI